MYSIGQQPGWQLNARRSQGETTNGEHSRGCENKTGIVEGKGINRVHEPCDEELQTNQSRNSTESKKNTQKKQRMATKTKYKTKPETTT